jgi:hypothetical protein
VQPIASEIGSDSIMGVVLTIPVSSSRAASMSARESRSNGNGNDAPVMTQIVPPTQTKA